MQLDHVSTVSFSRDGGPPVVLSFGQGQLGTACLQASIDEAIGPGAVTVRIGRSSPAPPPARLPSWATDSTPRARRFHALGCRWLPVARRWSCANDCCIPAMIEAEVAADNDW